MAKKQEKTEEKIDKNQEKVTELESRVTDLEAQLKRAVADYQNLEKRVSDGRSELTNYVGAQLLNKMLPVLDHLEQALSGVKENQATAMSGQSESNGWVKGVEMAVKEFNQVLAQEGLGQIATDGQFDPNLHEAVDTQEGDDNIILKVTRKGYTLNGKVIRPAQVVVGRSQDTSDDESKREGEMSS